MVKTLLAALLVGGVTFAVVAGCSGDTDGTTVKNGSKSKGGDDDDDTTPKKGTSSGTTSTATDDQAGDCSKAEKTDDRPACDTCAKSKCCKSVLAVQSNSDAKLLTKCLDTCGPLTTLEGATCGLTCQESHPSGNTVFGDFSSCVQDKCGSECPSTIDLGGVDAGGVLDDDDGK